MNMIKHILKKDIRRLRLFLIFWLCIVGLTTILSGFKAATGADEFLREKIIQMIYGLAFLCQILLSALLVPFLMHSEPLTGDTAFWLTRPIRKLDVMKSKLTFIGLFMILLPVLTDLLLYLASGIPLVTVLGALPMMLFKYASMILPLMVAAVLTRNFGFYALVLVVYLVTTMVLHFIGQVIRLVNSFDIGTIITPAPATLLDSRAFLSGILALLLSSLIIFIQYRTRHTGRGIVLLIVQVVAVFWVGVYAPWNIFPEPENLLSEAALKQIAIEPHSGKHRFVSDVFNEHADRKRTKEIGLPLKYSGLPENSFAKSYSLNSKFKSDDFGTTTRDFGGRTYQQAFMDQEAIESLIAPMKLVISDGMENPSTTLLKLNEEDFEAHKDTDGTLDATITFDIFRYDPVATLPLKAKARYKDGGTSFSIGSVLKSTGSCTVILREQFFTTLLTKQRTPDERKLFLYLLVNKETGDAVLQRKQKNISFNMNQSANEFLTSENRKIIFAPRAQESSALMKDEWLENAELMIVQMRWIGRTTSETHIENFRIGY